MLDLYQILSIVGLFLSVVGLFWIWKTPQAIHTESGFKSLEPDGTLVVTFLTPFKNGIPVVQVTGLSLGQNVAELSNVVCFKVTKIDKNGFTAKQCFYSAVDHTLHAAESIGNVFWFATENLNGVQTVSITDTR
jgi:hypothetical protein